MPECSKHTPALTSHSRDILKNFLEHIGNFCLTLSDVTNDYLFEAEYCSNVEKLDQLKAELAGFKEDNSEIYDWAKLGFNGVTCFFYGNRDIAMGRYETEHLERGRTFLLAFAERVPPKVAEIFQKSGVDFETVGKKNAFEIKAFSIFSVARAHLERGEYGEAARNFEECLSLRILNGLEIYSDIEPLKWYARGLDFQYEQGKFSEAADSFRKSSELYQKIAEKATLTDDIFEEGRANSMKVVCD